MCGIAGIIRWNNQPVVEHEIRSMCRMMVHRGPDEEGIYVGDGVALGMRRLSIIDLEGGQQPVFNEDRSICVVFNGEIYNYQELHKQLVRAGHRSALTAIPRRSSTCTRITARAASTIFAACSRSRSGTSGTSGCCWPAIAWASSRSTTRRSTAASRSRRS